MGGPSCGTVLSAQKEESMTPNEPLTAEMFQSQLRALLPNAKAGAEPIWADFAQDCVKELRYYVDSVEEPDEIALSRWYDTFLSSFILLKRNFGEDVATFICDLSLDDQCLFPCEMERAGQDVKDGGNVDTLFELMEDGLLEAPEFVFPKLRDVAPEMMPGMTPQL